MSRSIDRLLRRLEFTVVKQLDGLLHGDYRTLFRGDGLDLADLREYQFHDDVRQIDWNVTARLQTPYVRDYNESRDLHVWFLLDLSPSIDAGFCPTTKRGLSVEFVAVIAGLLTGHGNRVGGILYGDHIERVIPARGGRVHLLHLLQAMEAMRPLATTSTTDLGRLLTAARRIVPKRSLVFVVSDFLCQPGWIEPLQALALRHEVIGVRLVDPAEIAVPRLGMIIMQDAETGEQLFVDTLDDGFQRRFSEQSLAREAAVRDAFGQAGIDGLEIATDEPLVDAIIRFIDMRRLSNRQAGGAVRTIPTNPGRST